MQLSILFGAIGALLAQVTIATATPPAWCRGGDEKPSYDPRSLYSETDVRRALTMLVAAVCYPENDLDGQGKQIAITRDRWSKRLGLVEDDWAEVSTWAHLSNSERGTTIFEVRDRQLAWSAYSPLDQFALLSRDRSYAADSAYVADAFGAKLTQLGRLGYVASCIDRMQQDDGPVGLAMCASDAAALDFAKLDAEIRADKTHGVADRMTARLVAFDTIGKLPALAAHTKGLRDKDPAYATMFSLGETAHKQWATIDPKLIALAADLDDARVTGSRKASAGCAARAQDAWKGAITSIPVKRLAEIHAEPGKGFLPQALGLIVTQPSGYLAALALTECATLEGKEDFVVRSIGNAIMRWSGFRGPRTGTQTAIIIADLKLDQRDAAIDYPDLDRDWIRGDGNTSNFGFGAVSGVTVEGEMATVTFAKQKIRQTRCTRGHYTRQISQIMSDGTVVYYYQCDKQIDETIEVSPSPPMKVHARFTTGIKAGMTVSISDDTVVVAYPKGSTTPAIVTGVVVK